MNTFDPSRRRMFGSLAVATAAALAGRVRLAAAESAQLVMRPIPSSGEKLPVVGLGTSQVFDIGNDPQERAQGTATLRAFLASGLRVIDTSPMYGRAEAAIGELLEPLDPQHHAFLATKVWTHGAEAGRRQIDNSFRLLRRDKLDLIQVHNLVDVDTQLATLQQLKKDGRIRYVGITSSRDSVHPALVRQIERGGLDFVQVNYALSEPAADKTVLPAAAAHGVAVLVNRPFSKAGLFDRVRGKPLPAFAADIGVTSWAQFALKWVVSHPAVTCAIPGTRNPKHMLDDAAAATGAMPDAAMRAKMAAAFASL